MLTVKLKHVIATCLMLALLCQSLIAVSATCLAMTDTEMTMMSDMAGMDHSSHDMAASSSDSNTECCGEAGCVMANCLVSPAIVLSENLPLSTDATDTLVSTYANTYYSPDSNSLFRPPIFC